MICLVTGGAGFIGSHLVDKLIELGHTVVVIDNLSTGNIKNINPKAKFYRIDITDDLNEIFKKEQFEYVYHLAAQINLRSSITDPKHDANINIIGSLNVIENCRRYKVKSVIFSSTGGAIYDSTSELPWVESSPLNPTSPYGLAKLTVEKYLELYKKIYGLNYHIMRYANVYGPRQNSAGEAGVIAIFIVRILQGKDLVVNGNGEQTRDFIFIDDLVKRHISCLDNDSNGIIQNIGTGIEVSINRIIEILLEKMNSKVRVLYNPAITGELLRSCLLYTELSTSIEDGIEKTIEWFQANN